jgi:hypothetical protein
MSEPIDYDEFMAWARPQIPKFIGPAKFVVFYHLLKNIWQQDPEVRRIFREGREQMAAAIEAFNDLRAYEDAQGMDY